MLKFLSIYKESVLQKSQHTFDHLCQLACFNKSSFAAQYISSEIMCLSNNFWLMNILSSLLNCSLFFFKVSFACTVFVISIPSFLNVLFCNYVFVHKYVITLLIIPTELIYIRKSICILHVVGSVCIVFCNFCHIMYVFNGKIKRFCTVFMCL